MSMKWVPDSDPHQARRVGKTMEELGELIAVLARISIQGLDEIDPTSGKTNRERLQEETADVRAQLLCNDDAFSLDVRAMDERIAFKRHRMSGWEAHFEGES